MENTVTINKATQQYVLKCLQVSQEKITLLQTQTRLLHDALERYNIQHSQLVLVENPLFEYDQYDDVNLEQHPAQEKINEKALDSSANEDKLPLSKPIIIPWE
jgi:hypothetical protein